MYKVLFRRCSSSTSRPRVRVFAQTIKKLMGHDRVVLENGDHIINHNSGQFSRCGLERRSVMRTRLGKINARANNEYVQLYGIHTVELMFTHIISPPHHHPRVSRI